MTQGSATPRAVTFDCWGTLIYERDSGVIFEQRVEAVVNGARACGLEVGAVQARGALESAWQRHWSLWQEGVASGSDEMARWTLEALAPDPAAEPRRAEAAPGLARDFAEAALRSEILPLEGARASLEGLAAAGIRRALICDTGFSPGSIVRQLLDRAQLLELLEVTIFSDEAGVPKPHPRVFRQALVPLGLVGEEAAAVHVGDLLRTDVAGARAAGMTTVRIRAHHDDQSELPEADHVADSHAHLLEILAVPAPR